MKRTTAGEDTSHPASETTTLDLNEMHATLALFEKVAIALHSAHEKGLVHRDLKPGNTRVARTLRDTLMKEAETRDLDCIPKDLMKSFDKLVGK